MEGLIFGILRYFIQLILISIDCIKVRARNRSHFGMSAIKSKNLNNLQSLPYLGGIVAGVQSHVQSLLSNKYKRKWRVLKTVNSLFELIII